MRRVALAAALAASLVSASAQARVVFERGDVAVDVSGSLRDRAIFTHGTSTDAFNRAVTESLPDTTCIRADSFPGCSAFRVAGDQGIWNNLTRLRTRIDFRLAPRLSGEIVYDHEFQIGTLDTIERGVTEGVAVQPFARLEQDILDFGFGGDADEAEWRHLLYRAYLAYETDTVEAIVGRQRIPWGVGRIWSPMDHFNFVQPLAIEADQTAGVDAVLARYLFSGFTWVELIYAPLDNSEDSAYAGRLHGVAFDADYSLMGGVFQEAIVAGGDFARNLGDAAIRLEAVYSVPDRSVWPIGAGRPAELRSFWQVVASLDRNFDFGSGVYVLGEYLYNGNALGFGRGKAGPFLPLFEATDEPPPGLPAELAAAIGGPFVTTTSGNRLGSSQVVSLGRHQTAVEVSYEFMPALHGELVTLYDWEGTSVAVAPVVRYDPFGFLELTLGAQLFAGPRRSEYGSTEHLAFLIVEGFY